MSPQRLLQPLRVAGLLLVFAIGAASATREILLLAGTPSHPHLEHEHNADAVLFARILNSVPGIHATASRNGWPSDPTLIEKADAVWMFCNGGGGHLAAQAGHAAQIQTAVRRGAGIMLYHYALEPPETALHREFLDWVGGYFELNYSVNPVFEADFKTLPKHPVTRGVRPFRITDEWYYNMRFPEQMKGVTQILIAVPPASSLSHPDGPHEGNPEVRSKIGQPQCLMWAYERAGGGRGIGFTGGHFHMNLADDNFRKIILNALVWIAGGEVPPQGIESAVSKDELMQNLDVK